MEREDYVAHRLGEILYEAWTPQQVKAVACLSCEAVDEWNKDRLMHAISTIPTRRDLNVGEAAAYRDGVEDVSSMIAEWEKFWDHQ